MPQTLSRSQEGRPRRSETFAELLAQVPGIAVHSYQSYSVPLRLAAQGAGGIDLWLGGFPMTAVVTELAERTTALTRPRLSCRRDLRLKYVRVGIGRALPANCFVTLSSAESSRVGFDVCRHPPSIPRLTACPVSRRAFRTGVRGCAIPV